MGEPVKLTKAQRINVDMPDGCHLGISVPVGVDPEAVIREFESMNRQVAFGRTRRIASLDGPPRRPLRWLRWALACTVAVAESWGRQAYAQTLGLRAAKARIAARTTVFRAALTQRSPS